jgi:hypothetical protein
MLKNKRLLLVPVALVMLAVVVLGMRIGFPHHRRIGLLLLALGWVPLIVSCRVNRQLLRAHKTVIKQKTRPYLPHAVVAVILLAAFHFARVLFPVDKSPLAGMAPDQIRTELAFDLESLFMLRKAADDIVGRFTESGLLQRPVEGLSLAERNQIRALWRDGVMAFLEFDLLKEKYRGFYQIDYIAHPQLHADAFLLAYMGYMIQHDACLQLFALVDGNTFMETLLNEAGEGIPADTFFTMRHRLTNPNVMLRINAATAYYELVKKDLATDVAVVSDFEKRRRAFFRRMGSNADIILENPLNILERVAFETLFPVQKNVALQMSNIRTARRDYLITAETLARCRDRLQPGDILVQRRNWHMTNIGIPGFWPHVALYVGTPSERDVYFSELGFPPMDTIRDRYPEAFRALQGVDAAGYPMAVIESIRPGVVFQSLETSAKCDYLGVIRPNLSKSETFEALLSAFSHAGKPYDLNFDFTTDNELVCSELIYKAFLSNGKLPFVPEVVNGRLLLPPNRMIEQAIENMGDETAPFSFVLFLDAEERTERVIERDAEAFKGTYARPKWDILQQ